MFGRLSEAKLCLAGESGHAVEILREGFRENSGRDFAIQLGAGRAIDFGDPRPHRASM